MSRAHMDDMWEIKQYWESTADKIKQLYDSGDREAVMELLTDMQQRTIEHGTMLENAGFAGTPVIDKYQLVAECCYRLTNGSIDAATFVSLIEYVAYSVIDLFEWTLPEGAHNLSIAAIVKNEPDIIEWIKYHMLVGVDLFYIYDNESTDGLKDKLKPYVDAGIVTYEFYPGRRVQIDVYNKAINDYQYATKWLAIIDSDEFIVPVAAGRTESMTKMCRKRCVLPTKSVRRCMTISC